MRIRTKKYEAVGRRAAPLGVAIALCWLAAATGYAADALAPIELGRVQVGGEIGRRVDVTIGNNLLALDADKDFLPPFAEKQHQSGYIGLGKLIDAAVRFAAYRKDDKVLALKKHLVDRAIRSQEPDGYLGMLASDNRMWGMWDVHEMGYLIYGLSSDYEFFGEERSLAAARKAADYLLERWATMPDGWDEATGIATFVSVTGLERTLIRLARLAGDRRYLDFCTHQRALPEWDQPIVVGRRPLIEGHIYANLCRSLAQLELYRTTSDERLLRPTRRAIEFLTRGDGMAITGGCGQWEIWTDDQDGRGELAESCATAYQIRVLDSLLRLDGTPYYGDLLERTIYNTLFAAQSPDGRKIRYYSPMEGERVYHPGDTYCCPCNYRRIIAELPSMVYYRDALGVTVNLYTPSRAELDLDGGASLVVSQQTDYPSSGRVAIELAPSKATAFRLRLRIPAWCAAARIAVNGEVVQEAAAGGQFVAIERSWQKGDQVALEMPMRWRLVRGRKRQAGRVAVMRGPVVFCLNPVQNERLAQLDGADLGRITLDPESLGEPVAEDSVRPGGVACRVQAWKSSYAVKRPGDLALLLTEFADPGGKATYFRLQDLSVGVDDELFPQR
ncbi:MAG TPA: beta-L-arabinofuranosidase domain-containing protein [Thermoguttaceae bacterium]|nr:beta-L-arabinofuranosidase domain-containing protein [Thermoguttaceae bacterium]